MTAKRNRVRKPREFKRGTRPWAWCDYNRDARVVACMGFVLTSESSPRDRDDFLRWLERANAWIDDMEPKR